MSTESTRGHYERWFYEETPLKPMGDYFGGSGFADYGYWNEDTRSPVEACENLMEKLLEFIPEKQGKILDVACGLGATTRHVAKHYPPENVTGVDISEKNLETCRGNAPGVEFRQMDATRLQFTDETFDAVISVEAAFHFDTRADFLREAVRVLKPGGRLVIADVLHERWADFLSRLLNPLNHIAEPAGYEAVLRRAGLVETRVVDVTLQSWIRSNDFGIRWLCDRFRQGRVDRKLFNRMMTTRLSRLACTRYYLLATGVKPVDAVRTEQSASAETVEFGGGWVPSGGEPINGREVLLRDASWSGMERAVRLRQTARAEWMIARSLKAEGRLQEARRHQGRARSCLRAARDREK